jgi:hypothetical protein
MSLPFPHREMARLARRVLAGEVVFFIGAGFSLDSEGNSAWRLLGRLLARFEAITRQLEKNALALKQNHPAEPIQKRSRELRSNLRQTFGLRPGPGGALLTAKNLSRLTPQYYTFNDWICSAFTALLGDIESLADPAALETAIHAEEERLLVKLKDSEPLGSPGFEALLRLQGNSRGKALFLDTMGFANRRIMTGPHEDEPLTTGTGEACLRDRHHVLARLAREGLCPTLLTTNYDLLLEWAFRLAGLKTHKADDPRRLLPPATYQNLVRIADATDFFGAGDDRRAAVVVKIHGCADSYRRRRDDTESWQRYLRALVFTYREIQNWREDSWSRDFLRTLLRTRTLVFCGYSGMDPVIHDTFRTVYEEMAERRRPLLSIASREQEATQSSGGRKAWRAPAYFFGLSDKFEFHGMEILRAASRAVGEPLPKLTEHPNYLRFHLAGDKKGGFPTLDEIMRWLYHLVFRRGQWQALGSDLRRISGMLLRRPCRESEVRAVRRHFARLYGEEVRASRSWDSRREHQPQLDRIAGWTDHFQVPLLRELATAESVLRNQGPGIDFETLRRWPWYFPAQERADWTAWAAVVELALRRMVAVWRGEGAKWARDSRWVQPGPAGCPAALFSRNEQEPTPVCLALRLTGFDRVGGLSEIPGAFRRVVSWEIRPQSIWNDQALDRTPSAADLWKWASRDDLSRISPDSPEFKQLLHWLGDDDERWQLEPRTAG